MSDPLNCLLIDIGNSRIKYTVTSKSSPNFSLQYCIHVQELEVIIKDVDAVWLASVGKNEQVQQIKDVCVEYQRTCHVVQTQAEQFGIRCAYPQYKNLGIDRWLAVLAAREITPLPVAVIDLGTANTCDIIVDDHHVGGWITPGFSLMKKALLANTQKVFADNDVPTHLDLGSSTPDAVTYGCLAAVRGFVEMAENNLKSYASDYKILVTGGDQNLLSSMKNPNFSYFPNLVLAGLRRFL